MSSAWSRLINFANGLISGQLPMNNGGTGKALTAVNGGLVYSDADSLEVTAAGTASNWVLSGGAGAPTMSNTTTTAKTVAGSADAIQLTVQGNATQTSDILVVEKWDNTDLLRVTNTAGTVIKGSTTGTPPGSGNVGHYVSTQVSGGSTTAADTWTASTGSLVLDPGTYLIGYSVLLRLTSVDANIQVIGNVAIYNGSANIDETISYYDTSTLALGTGGSARIAASYQTVVSPTVQTTYSLRTRCNRASTGTANDGLVLIEDDDVAGGLTGVDNSSVLWALRIN